LQGSRLEMVTTFQSRRAGILNKRQLGNGMEIEGVKLEQAHIS
jgi:hypothetical protein